MKWLNAPRPWILLASLSVNLFLAGVIVAALALGPHGPGRNRGHLPPPTGRLVKALGEEARPAIDRMMAEKAPMFIAAGDAHHAANEAYRAALLAEPFDSKQLEAALAARRSTQIEMRSLMDSVLVEAASEAGPDARKRLAEMRRRGRDRRQNKDRPKP